MPRVKYDSFLKKLQTTSMFTFKTVESKVGKSYAKVLLHNLKKKGLVIELVKGVYTFKKSPYMLAKAIPKSYVGLGSAAFLHGLWEQVSRITILSPYASLKARVGEREISGFKVVLRKISEKMFFGYELKYMEEIGEWIRVSDPEKTLIDLVYFNYPFKKEIVPKLLEIVDNGKVMEYMRVMKLRRVRGWVKILREIKPYLN
jgi:predicted transcriptional regulator of viral defense system